MKIYNGYQSTTNCSSITGDFGSLTCPTYYETRGANTYNCLWNLEIAKCQSKYPQQCAVAASLLLCFLSLVGIGPCSRYATQSTCNTGSVYDDTTRLCKWNLKWNL